MQKIVQTNTKILFTQQKSQDKACPYLLLSKKSNIHIDFYPFVSIKPVSKGDFQYNLRNIRQYSSIIFTNKTTIDYFFYLCSATRTSIHQNVKFFFLTEQLFIYALKYIHIKNKKNKTIIKNSFDEFLISFLENCKEQYLIPGKHKNNGKIVKFLKNYKICYEEFTIFYSISNNIAHLPVHSYNIIVFFNPQSIQCFMHYFPNYQINHTVFATLGHTTAQEIKKTSLPLAIQVPSKGNTSLIESIKHYCNA